MNMTPATSPASANPWLVHHGRRLSQPAGRLRLYCFSYAGGSATVYQPWRELLDPGIELCGIQLPGRGMRMGERPVRDLSVLVRQIAAVIVAEPRRPFAFFGHSVGALVAFELTRYLSLGRYAMPQRLFVSGAEGPQCRMTIERLDEHDDQKMIDTLLRYKGTPPEVLQHRELMTLLAPAIRADFALAADYEYRAGPLLDLPITAFAGRDDDETLPDAVDAWRRETRGPFQVHWFDGDHFFIHSHQRQVVARLNAELSLATSKLQALSTP